jgi:hypothetical protein
MQTAIEINKPLVAALRTSDALPNTQDHGSGNLHVLYAEHYRPVGYLVEKIATDDPWEGLEPRYFITTSHAEAVRLISVPLSEIPRSDVAMTG